MIIDRKSLHAIPKRHRVDLLSTPNAHGFCFESCKAALEEDRYRLKALKRWRAEVSGRHAPDAKAAHIALTVAFVNAVKGATSQQRPGSLASSIDFRHWRIRESAKVLALVEPDLADVRMATVVPNGEQFTAAELANWDVERFKARFRSQLNRLGTHDADGYVIAYFHCDYDPATGMMSPHWHLLVKGGMIEVIKRLRRCDKYRSVRLGASPESPVKFPVRIHKGPPKDLVSAVTYLMKSYWSAITSGESGDGRQLRYMQRRRIPEPVHTEVLLWLHQHRLCDLRLLVGVRETTAGLIPRK